MKLRISLLEEEELEIEQGSKLRQTQRLAGTGRGRMDTKMTITQMQYIAIQLQQVERRKEKLLRIWNSYHRDNLCEAGHGWRIFTV